MEEIEDDARPRSTTKIRLSPTASKRSREDHDDSGLDDTDPPVSDRTQEKLAHVMMEQLKMFEGQLSNHVMNLREQDHASREQIWQQTQQQMSRLEAVQLHQSNTLSLVAERLEAGLRQLSVNLEENQTHIVKCTEQITADHERLSTLERDGWRPDPWKKEAGKREVTVKQEGTDASSWWENPVKIKSEVFPPPKNLNWGKMPETVNDAMSFPSSSIQGEPHGGYPNIQTGGLAAGNIPQPTPTTQGQPLLFGGGGLANPSNLHKICAPPKFDASNLDHWKREMLFWRSMYQMIPDEQMVAAAGLQGNPELKEIVMDFTEENRAASKLPTFADLLSRIDREYGALTEVQRMDRLQSLMQFKRDNSWDIRRFWRNFRRVKNHAIEAGVTIPEDILFSQLLVALSLNTGQRHMVLAHFESTACLKTVENLQNITIRLFAAHCANASGTFSLSEEKEGPLASEWTEDDVWLSKGQKGKNSRPGYELNATRRSQSTLNLPNSGKGDRLYSCTEEERMLLASIPRRASTGGISGIGKESNPLLCLRCGSPEHFWRQCPHPFRKELLFGSKNAAENKAKERPTFLTNEEMLVEPEIVAGIEPPNLTADDSSAIVNDTPVVCLDDGRFNFDSVWVCNVYSVTEPNLDTTSIVIDSGASSSVCSASVVNSFDPTLIQKLDHGVRRFRFGDSRCFPSLGLILLHGTLPIIRKGEATTRQVTIQLDVIQTSIPILISRRTLSLMGAVIDFAECTLRLSNGDITQLCEQKTGHLLLSLDVKSFQPCMTENREREEVFVSDSNAMTKPEVGKLHRHTGHAEAGILAQMIRTAGRTCDPQVIQEVVKECPCVNSRATISPNIAGRYLSPYPGFSVFLDICYPREGTGHRYPHLGIIDSFSRFLIVIPLQSLRPEEVIASFERHWMTFLGSPRFLMKDGGPGTRSKAWEEFASVYDIVMVINPPGSVNQMGMIERHLGILKVGLEKVSSYDKSASFDDCLQRACVGKNNTVLMTCGKTPIQLICGKGDYFSSLENGSIQPFNLLSSNEARHQRHLISVVLARNAMQTYDAERIISLCLRSNLRAGQQNVPAIGNAVHVALQGETKNSHGAFRMKWEAGFRMLGLIGSNGLVERDGKIFKIAMSNIRNADHTLEGYHTKTSSTDRSAGSSTDLVSVSEDLYTQSDDLCDSSRPFSRPLDNDPMAALRMNVNLASNFSGCFVVAETHSLGKEDPLDEPFDPSRMFPSQFLADPECLKAMVSEINGLTAPDNTGVCPLKLVHKDDLESRGKKRILSTMVVRRKSSMKIKARLCLRGDTLISFDPTCSPTPYRSALRTILMLASAAEMKIATLDVSQAFIQASRVAVEDQLLIRVPWYIIMPWTGEIRTSKPKIEPEEEYYFLMQRPLYGLKDSPLRWYLHLCQTLRLGPYRQCRTDVCLFSRHEFNEPCAWLISYVDDILIAYSKDQYLDEFVSLMRRYRTGAVEKLSSSNGLVFLGMDITADSQSNFALSQTNFVSRLAFPCVDSIIRNKMFIVHNEKVKSFFRTSMGSLLWLLQTRYDLSFRIIGIAVRLNDSSKNVDDAIALTKEIHRIIRTAKENPLVIHFGKLSLDSHASVSMRLAGIRLFVFGDAGFCTLPGQKSIESCIIVAGREQSRDGRIKCLGSPIDYYTKKISRCVRSTVAAESAAARNALELGMWHQASLSELIFGRTFDYRLQTEDALPLCNPFKPFCPTTHINLVLCAQCSERNDFDSSSSLEVHACPKLSWSPIVNSYLSSGSAVLRCDTRSQSMSGGDIYRVKESENRERRLCMHPDRSSIADKSPMKVIGLTDSANAFSAISNIQPKSVDKLTKISLAFLRDISAEAHMSFIDAPFNIADAGTKVNANVAPFLKLCESRQFSLSFVGRKELKRRNLDEDARGAKAAERQQDAGKKTIERNAPTSELPLRLTD